MATPTLRTTLDGVEVQRWLPTSNDAQAPTIIMIHGAMDRSATFLRTRRRLSHRDVVVYDRRGYGRSVDATPIQTLRDHVDDLFAIINWLEVSEVMLVGHSLGGYLALIAASSGDERIVGVNSYEAPATELTGDHDKVGGGAVEIATNSTDADGAEAFYKMMIGDGMWERLRPSDQQARRNEGTVLMREFADLKAGNSLVAWDDITQPVTIGYGAESPSRFTTASHKIYQRLTREPVPTSDSMMPRHGSHPLTGAAIALHEIPSASHGIHITHPGEYADFIES